MLFLFICLNFSNKSKIKCATNAAAISGGMSHTMFPVIFVSILLYNLQKMFFSTFQQISMSNSHRTSCEFLKDIFGRNSGADGRRHRHAYRRPTHPRNTHERAATSDAQLGAGSSSSVVGGGGNSAESAPESRIFAPPAVIQGSAGVSTNVWPPHRG